MRSEDLTRVLVLLGATIVFNVGCEAHATGSAYAEADAPVVFVSEPTLVEIDAGVWVVQDYDYPVYFYADEYWVLRGGVWYRSRSYEGGWARAEASVVPTIIVNRNHNMYVHYRGGATARTRAAPGGHGRGHGPPDHAAEQHGGPPGQNRAEERHEEKQEEKHERAEEHQDQKREQADEHRGGGHDHDQGPPGRGKKEEKKGRR